jgi:putative hydrolase of the HAD superfamily
MWRTLLDGLELLSLDAGDTIVYFDSAVAAAEVAPDGFRLDAAAMTQAFGPAKRALDAGTLDPLALDDAEIPRTWGACLRWIVQHAGEPDPARSAGCVRSLWRAHRRFNLWRHVPDGLIDGLRQLRAAGLPICVVSNSEGRLSELLERLGILDVFDLVLDSHIEGIEKPDPRLFRRALDRLAVAPAKALHLGDVYSTDVAGAHAAGMRAILLDPFGQYAEAHPDVPRVPDALTVVRALLTRAKTERP